MLETTIIYGNSSGYITLNDKTKLRDMYKVSRVLMDSVKMRRGMESLEKKEGAEDFGSYRDTRIIQLFGSIIAEDNFSLNDKESAFRKMFNPRYAEYLTTDKEGYLPLKWTELHPSGVSRALQLFAKPYAVAKIDEDEKECLRRNFEVVLICKDPRKYDQNLTTLANQATGAIIANGDDFTYPIIEIAAADFTSVGRITNTSTGKYIELTGSFTGTLVIDMGKGTITAGGANKVSLFTAGSEFWELAPGANTINLVNIAKITAKFYKAYN